jgi:hypothetical protein
MIMVWKLDTAETVSGLDIKNQTQQLVGVVTDYRI